MKGLELFGAPAAIQRLTEGGRKTLRVETPHKVLRSSEGLS
jgi:hypothetical protein